MISTGQLYRFFSFFVWALDSLDVSLSIIVIFLAYLDKINSKSPDAPPIWQKCLSLTYSLNSQKYPEYDDSVTGSTMAEQKFNYFNFGLHIGIAVALY